MSDLQTVANGARVNVGGFIWECHAGSLSEAFGLPRQWHLLTGNRELVIADSEKAALLDAIFRSRAEAQRLRESLIESTRLLGNVEVGISKGFDNEKEPMTSLLPQIRVAIDFGKAVLYAEAQKDMR